MLIKAAAIARQMMRLILLPTIVILFFFKHDILIDHGLPIILGGFLLGYLAAAIICAISIARDSRFKMRPGWLLPRGFWPFSLSTMAATVFTFFYGNFDRMAVLSIDDVAGLGMYQAVITINMLLERLPALLLPSVLPTFSNLLSTGNISTFKRAFAILCRWAVAPITLAALVIMGFSREILSLFGEAYVEYAYLLTLFGFVGITRSMNLGSLTVITCMEKNTFRFFWTFSQILAQVALTFVFLSSYGVMAIAGAKMIAVAGATIVGVLYIIHLPSMALKIPLSYKIAVLTGAVMTVLRIWVIPVGWVSATVLTLTCMLLFLLLSRFGWIEIRGLIQFIIHHDVSILARMAEKDQNGWTTGSSERGEQNEK